MVERKSITTKEHKAILLDILFAIDCFCTDNSLNFYLVYGTLLGAVRHRGMIPWDDDIDIGMFRLDYEKFVSTFNSNRSDSYKLVNKGNTKDYYLPFAKIIDERTVLIEKIECEIELGVYVDIYPIDFCSSNYYSALKLHQQTKFLKNMLLIKNIKICKERLLFKNILLLMLKVMFLPIKKTKLINVIDGLAKKFVNVADSKYCAILVDSTYGIGEIMETLWFSDEYKLSFEKLQYLVPTEYNRVLTNLYGDYMTPPPIEKQVAHHEYIEFWK